MHEAAHVTHPQMDTGTLRITILTVATVVRAPGGLMSITITPQSATRTVTAPLQQAMNGKVKNSAGARQITTQPDALCTALQALVMCIFHSPGRTNYRS